MLIKIVKTSLFTAFLLALGSLAALYLHHQHLFPATDDAYLKANVVQIAPQLSGQIASVAVQNLQHVKKGQLLFTLDDTPYRIGVDKAEAELDSVKQQIQASISAIQAAKAAVNQHQAEYDEIKKASQRAMIMVNKNLYPQQAGDEAIRNVKVAKATLLHAQQQLHQAENQLGDQGAHNASLRAAEAALQQAKLNLSYTRILAPISGTLANFSLHPGSEVSAYQTLFSIVDNGQWWVEANFKETQLARIHPGQSATVTLDMYPNHLFHGVVADISPSSGESMSLVPAENASGNWIKVTQRFPVRILIKDPTPAFPLRLGASSQVNIDTRAP